MKLKLPWMALLGLLVIGLLIVGCGATEECPECPECPEAEYEECPECPACPPAECPECPECPPVDCPECPAPECPECPEAGVEAPFAELWAESAHNDAESEAFRHWDEDDPAVVSTSCAKCHSGVGLPDFLGADGTEAGVVDNEAPIDTTITCTTCHNAGTVAKDSVVFPSGVEIAGLGPESVCMECHQGRASGLSVENGLTEAGIEDMDVVSEEVGFTNIHYFAAASTMYGTLANGGYQYEGMSYDAKFDHVDGYDSCVGCHDSHTLELKVDECATCHTESDPKDIRMAGSLVDFDGDGDMEEGIYYEVEGLRGMLYEAMQAYSAEVAGTPIVYDAASYPYFFDEAGERFGSWTGRLAKAAYNYQTSLKDPGAYAHGGKYIIQLLHDSIEDLNAALSSPIDLTGANRIDHGHFAGSEEAFRHWDEDGAVSASCAKCHSAEGLPLFLAEGVNITAPIANGFECATCHSSMPEFTIYEVSEVEFPSGVEIDSGNSATNICLNCHQGRSSSASVEGAIADKDLDTVIEGQRFINVHYFAAGATLFGNEVQGAYQYADKEYVGRFAHVEPYSNCTQCHSTHMLEVKSQECSACHAGIEELTDIRITATDFDGDGDTAEGIAGEIATMADVLYAAMQEYAANTEGVSAIVYDAHAYPYFFDDAGESFGTWTPRLLRAAYNYQYAQKDPGAFAHNGKYVIQFLYDGIEDLGGDVSGMTRP